ncbi:MAG: xylulokinase [Planctomycetota bacterium]
MPHLLGIDIGTSGTKSLVLGPDGKVKGTATSPHTLVTPKPGWTEQDPLEWWGAVQKSVRGALRAAKITKDDIIAIGLSGQMHGSVFLDEKGRVLRLAILWNDQRTGEESKQILETVGGEQRMLDLTGNLPLTGYTLPKFLWFKKNEAKKFGRLEKVVLPKDYIRYRMTGLYVTDVGDASGMCMLDVRSRQWSTTLLDMLKIDRAHLPDVVESTAQTGELHKEAAAALGLNENTPVFAGSGDVMTGAVGMGVVEQGLINANLGTGGVMAAHSDRVALDTNGQQPGRIATMCHAVPDAYVNFGCMLSAAGSLQWYADEFAEKPKGKAKPDAVFDNLVKMAEKAPIGSEGLFFMPFLTGERCPYPDPDARACWIGMTRRTQPAHLVRSLIEGVTYNMGRMLEIMRGEMGVNIRQVRTTGGGAKSAFWRQLQADIYDAPVATTNSEEGAAFGAALLAGVGLGNYKSVPAACKQLIKAGDVVRPKKRSAEAYKKYVEVYAKQYERLAPTFQDIKSLSE